MERFINNLWEIWYNIRLVPGYKYNKNVTSAWLAGHDAATRESRIGMVHPSMYDDGFHDGYRKALENYLDDECTDPIVIEARECQSKKERNRANS
jgi:hypothetical protein